MMDRVHNERGAALIVAIMGLVMMGGLVTASFTTTWLEFRLADNARRSAQAFGAADFGLTQTIEDWSVASLNTLDLLDSVAVSGTSAGGSGTYSGYVKRVADEMFVVEITGTDPAGGSRQKIGQFVRLSGINVDIQAALTVQGPTTVGGSSQITATDSVPDGWDGCGSADAAQSGIRMADTSNLTTTGACSGGSCITGDPIIEEDAAVADSTFDTFGEVDWGELASYADTLPPATYSGIGPVFDGGGKCDVSVLTNWGDPVNVTECSDYFPLLYTPGNLRLSGGEGQGMLLVEGDLSVSGGFEFYGVVIVKGTLSTTGTGGHFNGAVMAQNVNLDQSLILGNAVVQYSSCATNRAVKAASVAEPLPMRGWLYTN